MGKNPPAMAGDIRDVGLIPASERSPGGGHGNPLQNSCLENSVDGGAWWATVHRVSQSQTRLKRLHTHTQGTSIASTAPIGSLSSLILSCTVDVSDQCQDCGIYPCYIVPLHKSC